MDYIMGRKNNLVVSRSTSLLSWGGGHSKGIYRYLVIEKQQIFRPDRLSMTLNYSKENLLYLAQHWWPNEQEVVGFVRVGCLDPSLSFPAFL